MADKPDRRGGAEFFAHKRQYDYRAVCIQLKPRHPSFFNPSSPRMRPMHSHSMLLFSAMLKVPFAAWFCSAPLAWCNLPRCLLLMLSTEAAATVVVVVVVTCGRSGMCVWGESLPCAGCGEYAYGEPDSHVRVVGDLLCCGGYA
jgi:hypothetical protein